MESSKIIYCSLDIETSGFDPAKDEILEIGFVKFKFLENKFTIIEEYNRLFKPKGEVSETVLALTGITRVELEKADDFIKHREEISEKLKDVILVGHNIDFDLGFLKSLGMNLSEKKIDTLDLAQFILPCHPAYNLENLSYFFHINSEKAHRALSDAKTTFKVLENLCARFWDFPKDLKKQIIELVKPFSPAFLVLLKTDLFKNKYLYTQNFQKKDFKKSGDDFILKAKKIYLAPFLENNVVDFIQRINLKNSKLVIVCKNSTQVYEFWRKDLAEPFFKKEDVFNPKEFGAFLKRKNLTWEETKFAIKILVWKKTNWQTTTTLDLNLSFFGGQFKQYISGGSYVPKTNKKIWAIDFQNIFLEKNNPELKNRLALILGLENLEEEISSGLGHEVSWGKMTYYLKSIYNPENDLGQKKFSKDIVDALSFADLFFGLASALYQTDPPGFVSYSLEELVLQSQKYNQLQKAAENFVYKMEQIIQILKHEPLKEQVHGIKDFFVTKPNTIHWMELGPNKCVFVSKSLDISNLVHNFFTSVKGVSFLHFMSFYPSLEYYIQRFSIKDFAFEKILNKKINNLATNAKQLTIDFNLKQKTNCFLVASNMEFNGLLHKVEKENLPGVIVFPNIKQLQMFHQEYFFDLKKYSYVAMQMGASGTSKLLHNYFSNDNSLLLVTSRNLLNYIKSNRHQSVDIIKKTKTLIIGHLPFDPISHPYTKALEKTFENSFLEYSWPRALNNLSQILNLFASPSLSDIYLFDSKLSKDYASILEQEFKEWGIYPQFIQNL